MVKTNWWNIAMDLLMGIGIIILLGNRRIRPLIIWKGVGIKFWKGRMMDLMRVDSCRLMMNK